jgi:5-methylcytosine-specific restriction endonuclease McrA
MCAVCYTLKRKDKAYFGGLRESVLQRDHHRCRVCSTPGKGKRTLVVHHRVPGKSILDLMISLCPACHAKVHRTEVAMTAMPPLLLELWREQHPAGHEQTSLNFGAEHMPATF